jgi:hypothetical protein
MTSSSPTAAVGASLTFTATSTDADGDTLAYAWQFPDGALLPNASSASKTFSTAGEYVVRCTASDMKGGATSTSVVVTIGGATTTFRLSGTVTNSSAQPIEGVRIGDGTRSTLTNSDGSFTLVGVPAGSYTVSAAKFDHTFTAGFSNPVAVSANVSALDFTGVRAKWTVSGKVMNGATPLPGAVVSDGTRSATTNATGDYSLTGVPSGRYTLTATLAGWAFRSTGFTNPVEVNGGNLSNLSFAPTGVTLSGRILGASVAATVTDGVRSVVSYLSGSTWYYSLTNVPPGSRTLSAAISGATVTPSTFSNPLIVGATSMSGLDFVVAGGTVTFTISGTVTGPKGPLAGVKVGDGTRLALSDETGKFRLLGVPAGAFTVTPLLDGVTFTPASRSVTVSTADVGAIDFTSSGPANAAPVISVAPAAATTPVTGTTVNVSVTATDDGPAESLVYTWSVVNGPAAVTFSPNAVNAARTAVATFTKVGTYTLRLEVRDAGGLSTATLATVVVSPSLTFLDVTPATVDVAVNAAATFTAKGRDQFGASMTLPAAPTWTVSGGGTIDDTGKLTAGTTAGGPFTVTANASSKSGSALVRITALSGPVITSAPAASAALVTGTQTTLSVLGTDDGGEANLTYTWTAPSGATLSVNGTSGAKSTTATFSSAGSYRFEVELRDADGNTVTGAVEVTVVATPTALEITPQVVELAVGRTHVFSAGVVDQFGNPLDMEQASAVSWTASGGGAIDSGGVFKATTAGGPYSITAALSGVTGVATVVVVGSAADTIAPTVSLSSSDPTTVLATATDDLAVVEVIFFVDGVEAGRSTTAPFELRSDALATGTHEVRAVARDAAGNEGTSTTLSVGTASTSAPTQPPANDDASTPDAETKSVTGAVTGTMGCQSAPGMSYGLGALLALVLRRRTRR